MHENSFETHSAHFAAVTTIPLGALVAESGAGIPSDSLAQRSGILLAVSNINSQGTILPPTHQIAVTPYDTQGYFRGPFPPQKIYLCLE